MKKIACGGYPYPYAGMIRIRFNGYDLSLLEDTPKRYQAQNKCFFLKKKSIKKGNIKKSVCDGNMMLPSEIYTSVNSFQINALQNTNDLVTNFQKTYCRLPRRLRTLRAWLNAERDKIVGEITNCGIFLSKSVNLSYF